MAHEYVYDQILKSVCLENEVYGNISLYFIITQRFCISCARLMHLLTAACAFARFRVYKIVFFLGVHTDA